MQALLTLLNHPLTDRIGWTLLHSVWLVTIVALIVAAELHVLRRHSAALQYFAAVTGLAIMALVPVGVLFYVPVDASPEIHASREFAAALGSQTSAVHPLDRMAKHEAATTSRGAAASEELFLPKLAAMVCPKDQPLPLQGRMLFLFCPSRLIVTPPWPSHLI